VKETDERNRQLQTQIDDQDRQLTTTALKLEEKRKVLHGIDTKMALARKEGTLDAATMQELRRMIKSHAAENDWNTFETYFNHSYPNLLKRLHQQYPDITEAELRHCSYVRMGLDIKETAHILNVQPDSVRKARQRLRHKLGINDPQSRLIDFLRSFEEHLED
jgi:DNA-binding CsgD family transcriptional regulator